MDLVSGDTAAGESDLVSGDIAAGESVFPYILSLFACHLIFVVGEGDGLEDSNHDDDGEDIIHDDDEDLSIHDDDDLGSHDDSEEEDASEGEWEDDSHSIATMETSTTSIAMGYSRVRKSDRKRQRKAQRLREKKEAVTAIEGKVSSGRVGEEERKERASNLVQSRVSTSHMHTHMSSHMHTHTSSHMHIQHIITHAHTHVIITHAHTQHITHAHTHVITHAHTHVITHAHTHVITHAHTAHHTCTLTAHHHTCTHKAHHTCTHNAHICRYMHYTYLHTCTHTHVHMQFLTQEEFEEIRRKRLLAQLDPNAKGMKRGADEMTGGEDDTEDWGRGELVSEAQIENVYKRHHRSKEEKLASVQVCADGLFPHPPTLV